MRTPAATTSRIVVDITDPRWRAHLKALRRWPGLMLRLLRARVTATQGRLTLLLEGTADARRLALKPRGELKGCKKIRRVAQAFGSCSVTTVPRPASLSTRIIPPCASMILRQIERPSPVPPGRPLTKG